MILNGIGNSSECIITKLLNFIIPKMCSLTRERYGIMAFPYLVSFRGNLKIGLT